jgi:radical SAM superfamily enzyme YgiQ (UPF0313 family)
VINRGLSPIIQDLDSIPFPAKDAHYAVNRGLAGIYTAIASRGCPYSCTYCNSATMNALYRQYGEKYHRIRSVENLMAELTAAVVRFAPRYIMFYDDLFGASRKWLEEFSEHYRREIHLPYYCQTNPQIHDEASLALLAKSGCVLIEFGFQAASSKLRREVLNRHESGEEFETLIPIAKRLGMFTQVDIIVNLPRESPEDVAESLEFVRRTRPHYVNLAFLQYHPKAPIIQTAVSAGILSERDVARIEQGRMSGSMRLLSGSGPDRKNRLIPFKMFFSSALPAPLSRRVSEFLEKPVVSSLFSYFGSWLLYSFRVLLSYMDRRDFLIRNHVIRSFYAVVWVFKEKVKRRGRH